MMGEAHYKQLSWVQFEDGLDPLCWRSRLEEGALGEGLLWPLIRVLCVKRED